MPKYYTSPVAKCPYYHSEHSSLVRCGWAHPVVHKVFRNRAEARMYKKNHCHKDYESCVVYMILSKKENPS